MYSIKIEDGHGAIFGTSIKLRNKFLKKFPNLIVQENVIQTIETLNKASVLDVFKFLMRSAASKDYLAQESHLEWAELTDDQAKSIWNEIRSQVNSNFKIFPCGDAFENTCSSFVEIWENGSFDLAINLFKSIVKYIDTHSQAEIDRAIFLLGSDAPNNNFGGILEIGYSYEEAVKCSKFSYQAFCLMDGLHINNCYMAAIPLLPYFGEIDQPKKIEAEKTSISEIEPKVSESNIDSETEKVTAEIQENSLGSSIEFTFDEVMRFIKNYELFKSFFVTVGGLRELGIEPQFVLEHEKEFCELLDTIDLHFQKR